MPLGVVRLGWVAWGRRDSLTRLVLLAAGAVVAVPLALVALAVAALAGSAPAGGPAARPMPGWTVSQPFGCTGFYIEPPRGSCAHFHAGIDLVGPPGTAVSAVLAGVAEVIPAGGYGIHVILHHSGDLVTLYAHLASVLVAAGQPVSAGALLGFEGSTGASTGAHLHFEVRQGGVPVDPVQAFPSVFNPDGSPVSRAAGTVSAAAHGRTST